jgi:hypothetical protein
MSDPGKRNGIDEMYTGAVKVFASVIIIFGLIILVRTIASGGGPTSTGVLFGVGFTALGSARLWLAMR